jgi:hypothetical protein
MLTTSIFDLYWALLHSNPAVSTANVIRAFEHYLRREKTVPRRGDFLQALNHRMANRGFRQDITPLLRKGITFNIDEARTVVQERLLNQLPE